MTDALTLARSTLRPLLDFALPSRCPGCGAITAEPHLFCMACWSQLVFLGSPCCAVCALPFDLQAGEGAVCGGCLARPPAFDRLRAAVAYGELPRKVALKLKYGGRPGVAETMASLMHRHLPPRNGEGDHARHGGGAILPVAEGDGEGDHPEGDGGASGQRPDPPILVPVPLHRWRIWRRGYNQAALIASALGRRTGLEARLDLIERVKATPPLKAMGPKARQDAVRGAFRVAASHKPGLRGRHVVLVDDVYTSGATANACAGALRRAGAARIEVLCWARVVRDGA